MPLPSNDRGRPGEERPHNVVSSDLHSVAADTDLDEQRARVADCIKDAYDRDGEGCGLEGLLEAIAQGLIYVGDSLRGAR